MPMEIHPVTGDIATFSPQKVELSALWMTKNSGALWSTWLAIRERYHDKLQPPQLPLLEPPNRWVTVPGPRGQNLEVLRPVHWNPDPEVPWLAGADTLIEVQPQVGCLRYFYLFSNRSDAPGEPTLENVGADVTKCLDAAARLQAKTVSMLHIPWNGPLEMSNREKDAQSAWAMIDAARQWDAANPEQITDLYLVDLTGNFSPLLPPED